MSTSKFFRTPLFPIRFPSLPSKPAEQRVCGGPARCIIAQVDRNGDFWDDGSMTTKPLANFSSFASLDIRVGKIVKVDDAATQKPTYRLTVDFGPDVGTKVSCGAYRSYPKESLLGKQVIGIVNFPVKKMGPEISEVLILGVPNASGETIYLTPESEVNLGVAVF